MIRRFGPRLRVSVRGDVVRASCASRTIELAPFLEVVGERIVAVGEKSGRAGAVRVEIFDVAHSPDYRLQLQSKFMAAVVARFVERTLSIKPVIELEVAPELEREPLEEALMNAGAGVVERNHETGVR